MIVPPLMGDRDFSNMIKHGIPSHYSSSWKTRIVLKCQHSLFQDAIQFHIDKIRQVVSHKPAVHKILSDPEKWDALKQNAHNEQELNKLQIYWTKVKPLAHLNSSALYLLYSEHVKPLERYLESMLCELNADDFKKEESSLWRPAWFDQTIHTLIVETQDNLAKLKFLKTKIQDAMLHRCELHQQFGLEYRIDDTLGVICQQFNLYQHDESQRLEVPKVLSKIDDNMRITFYDILKIGPVDSARLEKNVIGVIQKKSIPSLTTNEIVLGNLKTTTEYIYDTVASLELDNIYRKIFTYKLNYAQTQALNAILSPLIEALKSLGIYHLLKYKTLIGYFLLFVASFVIYGYIVHMAAPLLLLSLSTNAINAFNTFLFYSIGMAPFWYLCIKYAKNIRASLNAVLSAPKRQQLMSGLLALERSEYFMANRLSQSIVDIPNFDIESLIEQAEYHCSTLQHFAWNLRRFTFRQKMTSSPSFRQTLEQCALRLENQQARIKKSMHILSEQLATNMREEITLLSASPDKVKLESCLSKQQLSKIKSMVDNYGNEQTKSLFADNTNMVKRFEEHLDVEHMAFNNQKRIMQFQPWGGYELRRDVIQGWNVLLENYVNDDKTYQLLREMNCILLGEKPSERFLENINKHFAHQSPGIVHHFQWLVFNTLCAKNPGMAQLLSEKQKELISKWYHQHEQAIDEAQKILSSLFENSRQENNIDSHTLQNYYELLDGADIYNHAHKNDNKIGQRYNLARKYFEEYQGEHSDAFNLLKFVPKNEYLHFLESLAQKRLNWLLNNVEKREPKVIFDETDGELFHHFSLLSEQTSFNFDEQIKRSAMFNSAYSFQMENFLRECESHGLDNDDLLEQYLALHPNRPSIATVCVSKTTSEHDGMITPLPRRKNTSIKIGRR